MIYIKEDVAKFVPGETSLIVSFEYRKELVTAIKSIGDGHYRAKSKDWEFPITALAALLEVSSIYDDIDLTLLKDKKSVNLSKKHQLLEYKTKPFSHQLDAIQRGLNQDKFLLLADPGLGKTLVGIYLALELKARGKIDHCLIICGVNTLKFNWKNEILSHSDESCRILGERINSKGKVYISTISDRLADLKAPIDEFFVVTNIETIRNDDIVKEITKGKANKFDMIICDEIHKMKSPSSEQGKNFLKLTTAKHLVGLTGTLLTKDPFDLYVPLKWLGVNHCSFNAFKYYYASFSGPYNNILNSYKHMDFLKDTIDQYSLRQTKDLLDLPPKTVIDEFVEMNAEQLKFYQGIKAGIKEEVDKVELNTDSLLAMLTRLRQAISCPSVLTSEDIRSSKVDRICDLVDEIVASGEKVVIFSQFKDTCKLLYDKLAEYNPLLCTGDYNSKVISDNVAAFQVDENIKVIIGTSVISTGVTLNTARYLIFESASFSAAENRQAEDRIHRVTNTKPVFIYYLWSRDSIDIRTKEIIDTKVDLADMLVNGKKLDAARLKELLISED